MNTFYDTCTENWYIKLGYDSTENITGAEQKFVFDMFNNSWNVQNLTRLKFVSFFEDFSRLIFRVSRVLFFFCNQSKIAFHTILGFWQWFTFVIVYFFLCKANKNIFDLCTSRSHYVELWSNAQYINWENWDDFYECMIIGFFTFSSTYLFGFIIFAGKKVKGNIFNINSEIKLFKEMF